MVQPETRIWDPVVPAQVATATWDMSASFSDADTIPRIPMLRESFQSSDCRAEFTQLMGELQTPTLTWLI